MQARKQKGRQEIRARVGRKVKRGERVSGKVLISKMAKSFTSKDA